MPASRSSLLAVTTIAVAIPAAAVTAQGGRAPASGGRATVTSVTIQQRMVIRVPRLPSGPARAASPPLLPPIRWAEKKADKCVPLIDIAAAAVTGGESVDLILNGGRRLRASFGSECRALDFYSGFYVRMTADGKVCAARDAFRSRSGGECRIKAFRTLVPKR